MKNKLKIAVALAVVLSMVYISFLAGGHIENQKSQAAREEACLTLISYARDKAENEDLSNDVTMDALISNIYAAWCFCDKENFVADEKLHNLWNDLMNDREKYIGEEDSLIEELNTICELINPSEK